jgi:magnesium-transporting ATPase (P-type)
MGGEETLGGTVLEFSILGVEMGSGNLAIGQKFLLTLLFVFLVLVLRRLLVEEISFAWRGRRCEQVRFWVNRLLLKYIHYQMGSLFAFLLTFLGAAIFNILNGIPFLPLQVLWLNFTVDLFEAIGLGVGQPPSNLMKQSPRPADAQILPPRLAARYSFIGLVMAVSTLLVLAMTAGAGDVVARPMGLTAFSFAHIFFALEMNDKLRSLFNCDLLENYLLLKMSGLALLTTFLITELGFMNWPFSTAPWTWGNGCSALPRGRWCCG